MEGNDDLDDDGPSGLLLPPDDRLWRHPSELGLGASHVVAARRADNRMWGVALLAGAIGALLATGVGYATGAFRTRTVEITALEREVSTPVATLAATSTGTVASAATVGASCVQLVARDADAERISNGVVFRSDGMVLTTAHSLAGASSITGTVGGRTRVAAKVVATDPSTDLAVVKLDGVGYQPAPLGTALDVHAGDVVVAVEPADVTGDRGAVSAFGATVDTQGNHLTGLLRIATTEVPDTVGGPVLDSHGAVIGITIAIGGTGQAMEFATPVDLARQVASQLLSAGRVTPAWLGVEGHDMTSDSTNNGAAVLDKIYASSPAADVGLSAGDDILAVDGRVVGSMAALILAMHALPPGSKVTLTVRRNGVVRTMTVTLVERPRWAN